MPSTKYVEIVKSNPGVNQYAKIVLSGMAEHVYREKTPAPSKGNTVCTAGRSVSEMWRHRQFRELAALVLSLIQIPAASADVALTRSQSPGDFEAEKSAINAGLFSGLLLNPRAIWLCLWAYCQRQAAC